MTQRDELLASASGQETTEFDYIIVGAGAGGGPLAARLAEAGRSVLLVEAGGDPKLAAPSPKFPGSAAGEVTQVPGYFGAASEDPELSWMFSVRHYDDDIRQQRDNKYNQHLDPVCDGPLGPQLRDPLPPPGGKGGIFYPRSSGLGGCTAHHAMFMVAPNDHDWDKVADLTGDDSWRAARMRGYFAKLERCLYVARYNSCLQRLLGLPYLVWRWLVMLLDPRALLDQGGHGFQGWQPTNLVDPELLSVVKKEDHNLFRLLFRSAWSVLEANKFDVGFIRRQLFRLRVVQSIDYNDVNTRHLRPEGVYLIPIGTSEYGHEEGKDGKDGKDGMPRGSREGVRERILAVAGKSDSKLTIVTHLFVTQVLFEHVAGTSAPRAIGIAGQAGAHVYRASPLAVDQKTSTSQRYFARREVILCGGAFNTPQLLMLSGIGDSEQLQQLKVAGLRGFDGETLMRADSHGQPAGAVGFVHLPGVGQNLQDRYEVAVISEIDRELETLKTVTFTPGDPKDQARVQWQQKKTGLYTTNGAALAVVRHSLRSDRRLPPDIFMFGVPAAFRGYYWNWSRELFLETVGGKPRRNVWSWCILKAYTDNNAGTVRLRSTDPRDPPAICFRSFDENQGSRWEADLEALTDSIAFVRRVNADNKQFGKEIQPGADYLDDSPELAGWVKDQAWGHHACGTCRIGADPWRASPAELTDCGAVLDSSFRVHGVTGLRVVDASVFPFIPGYFIATPILMISEKAADVLLYERDQTCYPEALQAAEAAAIVARRDAAFPRCSHTAAPEQNRANADAPKLAEHVTRGGSDRPVSAPSRTVGLALSGGGVRSATFALGILQALSTVNRLREIDFLSTVSGGGFIGSFLGRLFTRRIVTSASDPAGRVQELLTANTSAPLRWLRAQANYLTGAGGADVRQLLATYWRNAFSVYFVMGALLFAGLGLMAGTGDALLARFSVLSCTLWTVPLSPWWVLSAGALVVAVLPVSLGYWLIPGLDARAAYSAFGIAAFLAGFAASLIVLVLPGTLGPGLAGLTVLGFAWLWQELARTGSEQLGQLANVVRNRMTRQLGTASFVLAVTLLWTAIDTLAVGLLRQSPHSIRLTFGATLAMLFALPALRALAELALQQRRPQTLSWLARAISLPTALVLVLLLDTFTHQLFGRAPLTAWTLLGLCIVFSLVVGRAKTFVNASSLFRTYQARLRRTFLGASNPDRLYSGAQSQLRNVQLEHSDDDLPIDAYHPEVHGGPLHLINVCVNESIDVASDRDVKERLGLSMCIGPQGVSVGRRYHALWTKSGDPRRAASASASPERSSCTPAPRCSQTDTRETELTSSGQQLLPLPTSSDPNGFHVFGHKSGMPAAVEPLTLGGWTALSGAAFATGLGYQTSGPLALFLGLINFRLGYWWDSGIAASDRPGRFPPPLLHRLRSFAQFLFPMQALLLSEWRGRFGGPSRQSWYLSDGGHFETTGLYELLRRRVELMVVVDAGEDPLYWWEDVARVMRLARIDFGAEVRWLDVAEPAAGDPPLDWSRFASVRPEIPEWILAWLNPNALGALSSIRRGARCHAALGYVEYDSPGGGAAQKQVSWILLIKPCTGTDDSQDVLSYGFSNPQFPQQSTFDQVFDDAQWESYRALGERIGRRVFRQRDPEPH